jgi:23S rRNA pseudouridine2605 synthase
MRERTRLFLYHKPRGLMTTHADPRDRPTIFQRLPKDLPRLISVGRLDFNTEGLLLLTNDGSLARMLELPATGWLRRYRVRAHGTVTQRQLDTLRAGVTISGIHYGAIEAGLERVQGANLWLSFAIREGKNREVRNVLGHLELEVNRLIRISFGPFQLGELAQGAVEEVPTRVLREQLGARLVTASGADFSAPLAPRPAAARETKAPKVTAKKATTHKATAHSWRAHEEGRPGKALRREYRGGRSDDVAAQPPAGDARKDVLVDRKGRSVPVERHGQPKPPEPPRETFAKRGRHNRRATDRSSGPRPHHPRGKR